MQPYYIFWTSLIKVYLNDDKYKISFIISQLKADSGVKNK